MPNREKVIKGLKHCKSTWMCNGCPYEDDSTDDCKMYEDALALLREPVRCKDCKIRGDINLCPIAYIEKTEQFTALCTDEWFCGNGKRR